MMYEAFTGKELRTCKRIFTKMVEYGHDIEKFFSFVDHFRPNEANKRPTNLALNVPASLLQNEPEEVLATIGWRQLKVWMKLHSFFTKRDLDVVKIKEFVRTARRLEWENTPTGYIKGG